MHSIQYRGTVLNVISDVSDRVGTSYLCHGVFIAYEMAELLFTFHRGQFPSLSSPHGVQNGVFENDKTNYRLF